jgi:hypothetical protein
VVAASHHLVAMTAWSLLGPLNTILEVKSAMSEVLENGENRSVSIEHRAAQRADNHFVEGCKALVILVLEDTVLTADDDDSLAPDDRTLPIAMAIAQGCESTARAASHVVEGSGNSLEWLAHC